MIHLDLHDPRPIYEQVVDQLEMLIARNILQADEQLPSVRQLAMELSLNPNTIQRAYAQLEQEGYLYTVTGRGNFVAPESEWREGKKREVLTAWKTATLQALDAGVTAEELSELLRQMIKESNEEKSGI